VSGGGAPLEFLALMGFYAAGFLLQLAWRAWSAGGDGPPHPWRVYATAAAACGLTHIERRRGFWTVGILEGRAGNFRVRLEHHVGNDENQQPKHETRISIERLAGQGLPVGLRAESRGFLQGDRSDREIEVGDKPFDDDFNVTGPHTFVRALLDAPTRRLLRALLLETGLEFSRGRMRGRLPVTTAWAEHEKVVGRTLGLMLQIARHFERPRDVVRLLAANVRQDPLPEVRLQNLLTLIREYPEDPATEETLVAACADASDWIRVRAATALGERGRPTLLEVVAREPPDEAAASQAIAVLGKALPPERVREVLNRALRARQPGTVRACLAALGQDGGEDDIDLMAKVMSVERGPMAIAAADALAATGSAAAERPLLAALARELPELRLAAARALGRVGSAAAVVTLKEAEARAQEADFSRAARQAIAEIQSRLPGASPGQLSIASGESGTLSLVEDERGRLSLPVPGKNE